MKCYLVLVACLLSGLAQIYAREIVFAPSDRIFPNPERGLYGYGPLDAETDFEGIALAGHRLCYAKLQLETFRTVPISQGRLLEIQAAFDRLESAGLKAIVRIVYNDGFDENNLGQDASLELIEEHLQQLQTIFQHHDPVIAFYQAGIIGAWGEWHASAQGLATSSGRAAVFQLLEKYLPGGSFIQVRTPGYVDEIASFLNVPLSDSTAFTNTTRARIGHHNDCWLASATDMGTYPSNDAVQESLKSAIEWHTRYVPWGGETCALYPPGVASAHALAEAERFHATYLNADYHPQVLAFWETENTLDVFRRRLGYRIELVEATLPDVLMAGMEWPYRINVRNSGWAPIYKKRPVFLRVLAGNQVLHDFELTDTDPRFWRPEEGVISLTGVLRSPIDVPSDQLGFALWLPDVEEELRGRPDYSIRCANEDVWDDVRGHNRLHVGAEPPDGARVISVDGDFSDWAGMMPLTSDPVGDHGDAVADVTGVWMTRRGEELFVKIATSQSVDWMQSAQCNVFMDLDSNPSTGYAINGLGSELLIQAGQGYHQAVGVFNGGTVTGWLVKAAPTGVATEVEFCVSGGSLFAGSLAFDVLLECENLSFVSREWVPDIGGVRFVDAEPSAIGVDYLGQSMDPVSGAFLMEWQGAPWHVYSLRVGDDLRTWSAESGCLTNGLGRVSYLDYRAVDHSRRFYQLVDP